MSASTTSMECESPAGPNSSRLPAQQPDALLRQQQQQHTAQLVSGQMRGGNNGWGRNAVQVATTTVSPLQQPPGLNPPPGLHHSYMQPPVEVVARPPAPQEVLQPSDLVATTTGSSNLYLAPRQQHQGLIQQQPGIVQPTLVQPNPLPYPVLGQHSYHASAASFPFQSTTGGANGEMGGSSGPTTTSSSSSQRRTGEDDSPMVGVCVQQSPVASH